MRRHVATVALVVLSIGACSTNSGRKAAPEPQPSTSTATTSVVAAGSERNPKVAMVRLAPVPVLFGEVVLAGDETGRFVDVTPAHGPNEYVYDAFFIDRQHGWVGFTDVDTTAGRLLRTVNGGRTWEPTKLNARQHQSAGSRVWLYFLDVRHGWAVSSAAAGGAGIYRSTDGGQTWSDYKDLESGRGPVLFDTPRHGWMAAWAGPGPAPGLYESFDAGDSWRERPLSPPPGFSADDLVFRLPTFYGSRGVLPAATGDNHVAFYSTSDTGRHWHLATTVTTPNSARAVIGVASARVWWVIPNKSGPVMVTEDSGRTWTSRRRGGLPESVSYLEAKDGRQAWASAFNVGESLRLYETGDGGETWRAVG
jgi:photosystem II stability/assembly factor-like uncharacterized protein